MALALGASACQTNENVAANGNADEDPICDCIVVDRDNPVLSEDVLLTNTPFGEQAKRLNDTKWGYTSFDTTLSVAGATGFDLYFNGHDSFSPSEKTGQGLLDSWPTSNGAWIPSSQQPASMPWEVHGVRVGQLISTVTASKLRADWKATLASNATRLQLHPDVIVVPIQAILVLPKYGAASLEAVMKATFGTPRQDLLWDDRWRAKRQRVTSGGLLKQVQGQWAHRTTQFKGRRWADPFTLPDDIFNECNIQFRLVSFNELRVEKERFELKRLDGRAEKLLCDLAYEIRPRLNSLDASAKALPGVRGDLPRVIFNWTVQPTACNQLTPVVDVACDPEDSGCSDAGFLVVGLENLDVVNRDLVLSHELGHVLSMSHRPKSECSTEKWLMCDTVGKLAPKIDFDLECDEARAWALKYRDAYLSGGG